MKITLNSILKISFCFLMLSISVHGFSQLPNCTNFYYHSGSTIYMYNTVTSTNSVNTITLPAGAGGLAVSNNLNAATPAVTFYTTIGGIYYYYNGTNWQSTGHNTGNASAVNIGGAGPYIFNLNGLGQQVYRYDGTGPGVLVLNLPGWGGPYDCIGDASGNFYILNTGSPPYALRMYSPNGVLLCTYNLVGFPTGSFGGGYAIVGNNFYATIGSTTCWGTITGTTINYGGNFTLSSNASDYANCEFPPLLVNIATPGNLTCASPTTVLTATSSLGSPTYTWSGPGIISGGSTATPTVNQPGTYTVTVTGTGGCTSSASATCTVIQTGGISVSATTTNILCYGDLTGSIDVTASNGSAPYQFSWSNGSNSEDQTNLGAGTYTVNVTDGSGCTVTASYTLTQPASAVTLTTSSTPALCGATDGSVSVNASGGTGSYTYLWNPGAGNTATQSNVGAGAYTVTVTDGNGCSATEVSTVTSSSAVSITSSSIIDVTCQGGSDGSISVAAGGGVFPYSYSWSNGSVNSAITNLAAGNYTVTVTDDAGCSSTGVFTVNTGSPPPAIDFNGDVLTGCVIHCVSFDIPGTIPVSNLASFNWTVDGINTGTNSTMNHCFNAPGQYDVGLTVVDSNGCTNTVVKPNYIDVQDYPVAEFTTDKLIYMLSDASVHVIDQSYNATTLNWNMSDGTTYTGLTDFNHSYVDTGTFCIQLIASSAIGCSDTVEHCIMIAGESYFYIPNSFTPNGDGLNDNFYPVASGIKKYSMMVFNRWGQEVFTSSKDDDVWNGMLKGTNDIAPQGVYTYKIVIVDALNKEHEFLGHVNLIR